MLFFSSSQSACLPSSSLEHNQLSKEHYNLVLDKNGQWRWTTEIQDNHKHLVSFSPFLWQDEYRTHVFDADKFRDEMQRGVLTNEELWWIHDMRTKREKEQALILEEFEKEARHFGDHEDKVAWKEIWRMLLRERINRIKYHAHCIDLRQLATLVRHALQHESLTDREFEENTAKWIQDVFPHQCNNFSFDKELMEIPALAGIKEAKHEERDETLLHQKLVVVHCFISADTPPLTFPDCWKKFAELYFTFFSFESVRGRVLGPFCNRQSANNEVKSIADSIRHDIESCVETILEDEDIVIGTANLPSFDAGAEREEIMEMFEQWDSHGDRTEIDRTIGYSADEGHDFNEKLESYIKAELEKRKLDFEDDLQELQNTNRFAENISDFLERNDYFYERYTQVDFDSILSQDVYTGLIHDFSENVTSQQAGIVLRLSGMHFAFTQKRIEFLHALIALGIGQVRFASGSDEAQLLEYWEADIKENDFSGESMREQRIEKQMSKVDCRVPGRFFNPLADCLDKPWYLKNINPLLNWAPDNKKLSARISAVQARLDEFGSPFRN